jgi:hypothetical protein
VDAVADPIVLVPIPNLGTAAIALSVLTEALRVGAGMVPAISAPISAAAPQGGATEALTDADGVAAATGTKASWWEAAARGGEVPHYKIGRWIRFRLSEVIGHGPRHGLRRVVGKEHKAPAPVIPIAKRLKAQQQ